MALNGGVVNLDGSQVHSALLVRRHRVLRHGTDQQRRHL